MRFLILFAIVIATTGGKLTLAEEPSSLPSLGELRKQVSGSLRAEAVSRRDGDNTPQVLALIDTYMALANDPRSDSSPFIQKLGLRVKVRLGLLRKQIRRSPDFEDARKTKPEVVDHVVAPKDLVLAQQLGAAVGGGAAGGRGGNAAQPNRPNDFGLDLVELIERTISPEIWDTNGGPASIRYYRPLRALVVAAPSTVHRDVGNVIQNVRAAGP